MILSQKSKNSQHYLGGSSALSPYNYDDVSIGYNFVKQVTSNYRVHYISNVAKTARIQKLLSSESYSYDHMGRRRSNASQLQDSTNTIQGAVRVSLASYNEIGQLTKKSLHSINGTSNFLQNVDYRYNARGWMTNINNPALSADGGTTNTDLNDQFGMELKYDNAATPQYNGNIGSTTVKTTALSGITYPALVYNYSYDKLNRLTDAISTTTTQGDGFYNENLTYDPMGNIQTLKRYDKNGTAAQLIDNLNYIYVSGNKVDRIDDSGTTAGFNNAVSQAGEYTYDGNGSQLTDLNRGLTQAYNMLNLPQTVTKSGISIAYIYDATGRKLRKLSTASGTTTVTEYIGGIQYQYSTATPVLDFISTEEGRARKSGSVYKYEYDLKDHLGNTRITTTWNPSDATQMTPYNVQRNDYYAFGYVIQSTAYSIFPKNEYLYNHKELQEETGLYDYGARFYDPVIGKWTAVDPLVEDGQESTSPYGYVFDDPIKFVDPDGRAPVKGPGRPARIMAGALLISGGIVGLAAPTVVGEAVAVPVAAVVTVGGALTAAGAWIWSTVANSDEDAQPAHTPAPENTPNKTKGQKNPTSNNARKTGQEAHRQKQKAAKEQGHDVEVSIELADGTKVRKDVVEKDGTPVIIKPDTKSGKKSAAKREELLKKNGYNGKDMPLPKTDLYNPNDPVYQPGSPTYIGPKS